MSAPTKQFHGLSITGDMPTTRSQPEKEPHTDDSDSSELLRSESEESHAEEGDSAASSSVRGKSGITYDLARLDSDTEARALVGLTSQFKVVSCCTTRTGFDFQFIEQPRVHLGPEGYTCTCSTFSGRPNVACQHIFVSNLMPPPRVKFSSLSSGFLTLSESGFLISFMAASSLNLLPPTFFCRAMDVFQTLVALNNCWMASWRPLRIS